MRPNQSLQLTAGRSDAQLKFMKHIVDVARARSRQRQLSYFSLDLITLHSPSAFALARLAIIILGTVIFILSTFLTRPWPFAGWVKGAFWILGVAGATWGAIRIVLLVHGHSLSRRAYLFLDTQQPFMLGIAFAMLALFFISGEAYRGTQRWRELKKHKS